MGFVKNLRVKRKLLLMVAVPLTQLAATGEVSRTATSLAQVVEELADMVRQCKVA